MSKKDQSICNNLQEDSTKRYDCERFANSDADNLDGRLNMGLSLKSLNMLDWKTYANNTFAIGYPDSVLIDGKDNKIEFSSKENGEFFDAGAGLRRDISRDYMVIATDQKECDMQKEGF